MIVDVMLRNRVKQKSDIAWARTRKDLFLVFYRLVRKKSSKIRFFRYFRKSHGGRILFKALWHSGSAASYKQVGRVRTQRWVASNLEGQSVGKIGCTFVGVGFRGELSWYVVATFGNCCSKVRAVWGTAQASQARGHRLKSRCLLVSFFFSFNPQ